ncbi:MAG: hypothetical protein PHO20_00265 [Candidatus Peribacteraceae bacterium]|nr:hypothetical protein [Candidatus Peribacteraceae bacterium]
MHLLHDLEKNARLTADASYQERMIERLRAQLPDKMRRLLDMHLRVTDRRLRKRYSEDQFGDKAQRMYKAIRSKTTRDVHAENLYDSILSTPEFPIHSKAYGISLLTRHLATAAIDHVSPDVLKTYALASVDMNGVKGMVDCTTYENVTHYLQAMSQFLLDRNGETCRWLEGEQKIKVTPLAAGGDEFALVLDAEGPLSPALMEEIGLRYQQEMANSQHLSDFLDFQSRDVRFEYSLPTEEQRMAFHKMTNAEKDTYLSGVRLPGKYYATCGFGVATLYEGLQRAVARGSLSLRPGKETFDSARFTIIRHMKELADAREADDKDRVKKGLQFSDPEFGRFIMRTMEGRELDLRLRDMQAQLSQEKTRRQQAERDLDALQVLCNEKNAQIEELLKKCA